MSSNDDLSLDKVFHSVGKVCAIWAEIDFFLGEFVHMLTRYHHRLPKGDPRNISTHLLLRNMDIRQKAKAASALAHTIAGEEEFFTHTKETMDEIGGDLRNLRNRLVHDDWVVSESGVSQINYVSKLVRPRPRKIALRLSEEVEHKDDKRLEANINAFIVAHDNLLFLMDRLESILERPRAQGAPPPTEKT